MKTEQQVRDELATYSELARRARNYWDENPTDMNYNIYREYRSKKAALEWVLTSADDSSGLPHTPFYPDYVADRKAAIEDSNNGE